MRTYTHANVMILVLIAAAAGAAVAGNPLVLAQDGSEGQILEPAPGELFVIGRDQAVLVRAQLPDACRGQTVEVALYHRSGPRLDGLVATTEPVNAVVSVTGLVEAAVPMPLRLPDNLRSGVPAVAGECLSQPLASQGSGIIFGLLDEATNGADSATFLIPSIALVGPLGPVGTELVAVMNGVTCVTVDLSANEGVTPPGTSRSVWVGRNSQQSAPSKARKYSSSLTAGAFSSDASSSAA
jgi:hypothetical protein